MSVSGLRTTLRPASGVGGIGFQNGTPLRQRNAAAGKGGASTLAKMAATFVGEVKGGELENGMWDDDGPGWEQYNGLPR